jgi:hypothetical protein
MKIVICLGLSKKTDAELLTDTSYYTAAMGASDNFSDAGSTAQITQTNTANGKFKTALEAPKSESKKANVLMYREVLEFECGKLMNIVSTKSNDPNVIEEKRLEIVESSGMKYTIRGGRKPQSFIVLYGNVSGSMVVILPGGAKSNLITYTKDVETYKDRCDPIPTTLSRVVIENMEKETKYAFFYKPILVGEKSDWIGPIIKMVL